MNQDETEVDCGGATCNACGKYVYNCIIGYWITVHRDKNNNIRVFRLQFVFFLLECTSDNDCEFGEYCNTDMKRCFGKPNLPFNNYSLVNLQIIRKLWKNVDR